VSSESEEVTSEENTDMHVSRGCYNAGRKRQIERVRDLRNVWKDLADTKHLWETFEDFALSGTHDTLEAIR